MAAARTWIRNLPRGRLVVLEGADQLPWLDEAGAFAGAAVPFLGAP